MLTWCQVDILTTRRQWIFLCLNVSKLLGRTNIHNINNKDFKNSGTNGYTNIISYPNIS